MSALDDLAPPVSALDALPPPTVYDPSEGAGTLQLGPFDTGIATPQWLERSLAGTGKAGVDLIRGAGQWLGLESRADVARSRQLDAPLMATTAGKVGNIAGGVGFALPTMLIPGANTVPVGAAIGAGIGALQPSTNTGETAKNIGFGGAVGAAGTYLGNKVADFAASRLASRQAAAEAEAAANAERDAVLQSGRNAGYVVPPTAVNPNAANTALESISGKAATRQAATTTNQKVTNSLIRQDLGLPENSPITQEALGGVRAQAGKVYQAVKSVGSVQSDAQYANDLRSVLTDSPQLEAAYSGIGSQADERLQNLVKSVSVPEHDAGNVVDAVKYLRNQAKSNFKGAFASGNPDTLSLARGQQGVADAMEDLLDRHLQQTGQTDLSASFDAARTQIAKSYQVEAALNGNNVSASNLAAQMRRGRPVSGGMELAAKFASHFGDVAGLPKSGAGVSKLAATIAGGSEAAAAYLGGAAGAVGAAPYAAAVAAAPYATRAAILSRPGQALLASPSYAPGMAGNAALSTLEAFGRRGYLLGGAAVPELTGTP